MKHLLTAILFVLLCGSISAAAAEQKKDMRVTLTKADTDKDGKITKAEFIRKKQEKFDRFDKNKDGFLDAAEQDKIVAYVNGLAAKSDDKID